MTTPSSIELRGYPVELGMSTVEHIEDWVREFKLMSLGREGGTSTHDVPQRLQAMVDALTRRYGTELSEPDRVRAAAARTRSGSDSSAPYRRVSMSTIACRRSGTSWVDVPPSRPSDMSLNSRTQSSTCSTVDMPSSTG